MSSRPNILTIITDQQSADAMSVAGNPHLRTPAMDRIAAGGVRFNAAYTSFPLCVPARTSMFTGRMPHEAGVFDNYPEPHAGLPFPMLGRLMTDHGYDSHYVGKWHIPSVAESDTRTHGFDEIVFGGGYGGLDHEKTAKAVEFIQQPHDQPFFLVVSYNNPHDCCELSRQETLRMAPIPDPPPSDELPPLPSNAGIPENEPGMIRTFQDRFRKILMANEWDELRTRQYLWGYYRLTELVDAEIGKVLAALEQTGLEQNTLVIFASDHGDGHGCHRWNQKWSLYDESARVPFLIADPRNDSPGAVIDAPVSAMLDLMPTLLDYAGIPVPGDSRGISLKPCIETRTDPSRRFVVSETSLYEPHLTDHPERSDVRMVRTPRFKYTAFQEGFPREQLIDLDNDPGEMHNLALDPDHQPVVQQHRNMLSTWCTRTRDDFVHYLPGRPA